MKKFLLMAVTAMGLLFTACSKDEVAQPVAEKSTVTFSVAAPELATRALGDGTTATQLSWAVYDKSNTLLFQSSEVTVMSDLKATVEIPFVNGMAYNILFWAEAPESPYSVEWANLEVGYKNQTLVSNSEKYDAFYCYFTELGEVTGPVTKTVELKRPFAQLNIKTNDHDDAVKSGLNVDKVSVEISEGCDKFNLASGEGIKATAGTKITFGNATKVANDHLAVNYLFTGGEKSLVNVTFAYTDGDLTKGGDASRSMEFAAVPVQRNYRTNIVGSLLTSDGKFNIEIKPGFDGEPGHNVEVVTVATAQDLQEAINNAPTGEETNITLTDDIDLNSLFGNTRAAETNTVTLAKGKKLVLDLNGFRLTGTDNTAKNYGLIQNNGDLTIVGPGRIETTATINSGWNRYSAVVSNNPGAVLTVENGAVLEHKGGTDMAYGIDILTNGTIGDVKATINGATIKSTYRAVRQFLNSNSKKNELIIKAGSVIEGAANNYGVFFHDPSTKANNGTLIIEQGAQVQGVYLFVTAGSTEWPVVFSIAETSITGEKGVVSANVPAGLAVGNENGVWTKFEIDTEAYVANIGTQGYETLQAAIEAVQEGETISLTKDLEFTEGINGNGISYTDNKSFTLDLKGKTVTSDLGNNALRFKIGDGNEVTNTEVTINIVNGKIVSGANNWCAISAAVANNSSNKLTLNLENLDVENYKANDYAVKAWAGAVINAENVDITSSYGGGFYAVGGELVLDNCTVNQKGLHTAPYNSMAVAVSNNGKATVNSGTYTTEPIAASDAYNQGTSHGSWAAGVMNSGGELIINGGTFANGNFGDDALATAARGLIFGDTASNIVINDGVFNALKNIIDYQNNLGVQPNPNIVINGGDFSADPTAVTSYGGVVVAEGKIAVQQANGRWILKEGVTTAEALAEAVAAGGDVVLGADITVSEPVIIPEGKTVALDLNGKAINAAETTGNHIYALKNYGTLTITDSSNNGSINSRGIYNYNSLTLNSGKISAIDGNGGYAVNNQSGSTFIMNGGWIAADYEDGDAPAAGNYDATALNVPSDSEATLNSGKITNAGNFTFAISSAGTLNIPASSTLTIEGRHGAISVSGGLTTIDAGTYSIPENTENTDNVVYTYGSGKITINGGTFIGDNDVPNGGTCVYDSIGGVTINGGTFGHSSGGDVWGTTGTVIKGGTFENLTETSHIAEGYKLVNGRVVAE